MDELFAEINITPLTDVMLVLLVIFMVSAPYLDTGELNVSLPESSAAAASIDDAPLALSILADGSLILAGRPLLREALVGELQRLGAGERLQLRCDRAAPCQVLVDVLGAAREAGVIATALQVERTTP